MLKRLNSLWVGNEFGYIERLCVVSALTVGHEFTIYSYTPEKLCGVPIGAEIRDACEVMPDELVGKYSTALLADFFR